MTKNLKIFLSVLALISIGISVGIFFGWDSFTGTGKPKQTDKNLINKAATEEIEIKPVETTSESSSLISKACVILDDQYCGLGKPIYENSQLVGIGFKLPAGSSVYAPFKGQIEKNSFFQFGGQGYPSLNLMDTSKDDWGMSSERAYLFIIGFFQEGAAGETIEEKQQVVKVDTTMVNGSLNDYNLVLSFKKYSLEKNELSNNIDLLKQFFPNVKN